jgi:hypothetical protein
MQGLHIRVLNLPHRVDRRSSCVNELKHFAGCSGEDTFFPAKSVVADGAVGCAFSHAMALASFLYESDKPFALILEDDFSVRSPGTFRDELEGVLARHAEWDVFLLAHNQALPFSKPTAGGFTRVLNAQTACAYVVGRQFAPELIRSFFRSAEALSSFTGLPDEYRRTYRHFFAVDMLWKELQLRHRFVATFPSKVFQRASYSDIEKRDVDYNC